MDNQPIGELADTALRKILADLIDGEITVKTGQQAAALIEKLDKIIRLEDNRPTEITSKRDVMLEMVTDLRREIDEVDPDGAKRLRLTDIQVKGMDTVPVITELSKPQDAW